MVRGIEIAVMGRVDRKKQISLDRMRKGYKHVSAGMSRSVLVFWIYFVLKSKISQEPGGCEKKQRLSTILNLSGANSNISYKNGK